MHESAHYKMLKEKIRVLAKERDAVILAHNYQEGAIQDAADFIGDSLMLSQKAAATDASVILFCGVHFMAETASILCPDKKVIIPDLAAGCSLADMVIERDARQWKERHPDGAVVAYVNTSAVVKAASDYCCTSSNAVKVVQAIPEEKEVLFIPDFYLGTWVKRQTGRKNLHVWKGYCAAHTAITPEGIDRLREQHPDAEFLMHPECGCMTKSMDLADAILSTEGMVEYAKESPSEEFIIATEVGMLYKLQKENPGKKFYPASENATCQYMQMNTLEKAFRSLLELKYEVKVPQNISELARIPIERMMAISANGNGNGNGNKKLHNPTAVVYNRSQC